MHVPESERKCVSHIATSPEALHRWHEKGLTSDDVEKTGPYAVIRAAESLDEGEFTSHDVVKHKLKEHGVFDDCGGEEWWSDLLSAGHMGVDFDYHANRVRLASRLRKVSEPLTSAQKALQNGAPLKEKKKVVQTSVAELVALQAEEKPKVYGARDLSDGVMGLLTSDEPLNLYLPTGFPALDSLIDGLHVGRLNVIAARTNHGKSLFADQLAINVAKRWAKGDDGRQVLKFDLENSDAEKKIRFAANLSGVPADKIKRHAQHEQKLADPHFKKVTEAAEELAELPITVDASQSVDTRQVRARVQAEMSRREVGLVVVDDIGNMHAGGADSQMEVAMQAVKGLHEIARTMGVPVLAVNQINRQPVTSGNGKPKMHHLAWSDDVAKKPALVMMLYNERQHYEAQDEMRGSAPDPSLTWLFVRKNKGSQGGKIELRMDKETLRLKDPNDQAPF